MFGLYKIVFTHKKSGKQVAEYYTDFYDCLYDYAHGRATVLEADFDIQFIR